MDFIGFQEKFEKNPKRSDDTVTKKNLIRYMSTFFISLYFVMNMPVYPLWNIRTFKNYIGLTAFGFGRNLSGSTIESGKN